MEMINSDEDVLYFLQKSNLFGSLTAQQLNKLLPFFKLNFYEANEVIINENDPSLDLYIIVEGEVEVLKKSEDGTLLHISSLQAGETIGEMGLVDNFPRSATIRSTIPTKTVSIAIAQIKTLTEDSLVFNQRLDKLSTIVNELQAHNKEDRIYFSLISNLAVTLSQRMRATNQVTRDTLARELELSQARVRMGKFMINVLLVLVIYMYLLSIIGKIANNIISTSLISVPLLIFFSFAVLVNMRSSGYPLAFYGLTCNNWRQSIRENMLFTLCFIVFMFFAKWLLIHTISQFNHLNVINLNMGNIVTRTINGVSEIDIPAVISLILAYLFFTPVQELVSRGALQSSLQEFLTGPTRLWWAILMSNILFSVTHLHLSITLALLVIIPGLFWGWLYARHKTLIGVSFSHLIVGVVAFFVLDINSMIII